LNFSKGFQPAVPLAVAGLPFGTWSYSFLVSRSHLEARINSADINSIKVLLFCVDGHINGDELSYSIIVDNDPVSNPHSAFLMSNTTDSPFSLSFTITDGLLVTTFLWDQLDHSVDQSPSSAETENGVWKKVKKKRESPIQRLLVVTWSLLLEMINSSRRRGTHLRFESLKSAKPAERGGRRKRKRMGRRYFCRNLYPVILKALRH